jgi:hypothetical protein
MSISSLIRPNEIDRGISPVSYEYTDELDIIRSSFDYQRKQFNAMSQDSLKYDERVKRNRAFENLYGQSLDSLSSGSPEDTYKRIEDTIIQMRKEGVDGWNDIPTESEIESIVIEKARQSGTAYEDTMSHAAPDTWKKTSAFVGQGAGWFTDPLQAGVTILTTPIATMAAIKWGGGILSTIAAEGIVGAATEAVVQPEIKQWQEKIGNEYTLEDSLNSIMLAGVFSGGFGGLVHGIGKMAGFEGFTPDQIRSIAGIAKKEEMNFRPGISEEHAHIENMRSAINSVNEGKIPDNLNPASSPKIFDSEHPEYEHYRVAQKVDGLKKDEANKVIKEEFINAIKKELSLESGKPAAEIKKLESNLQSAKDEFSAIKKEGESLSEKLKSETSPDIASEIDSQIRANKVARNKSIVKLERAKAELKSAIKSVDAAGQLDQINKGEIPASLSDRFNQYAAAVKKSKDTPVQDAAIKGYETKYPKQSDIDRAMETPKEVESALDKNYKQMVANALTDEKSANQTFQVIGEDGNMKEMTLSEIDEMLKEDEAFAKQVQACAMGAA